MEQMTVSRVGISPEDVVPGTKAYTVLRAARKIFLTHGFSGATTDMIQREAAVSKSTVYAHYANKEALFIAVVEAECRIFAETINAIRFSPGKLRETLIELAKAYLTILLSESGLSLHRIIVAEGPRFPALARMFYKAGPNVIIAMVTDLLARAEASQELSFGSIAQSEAARVFIHLVRSEPQFLSLIHPDYSPTHEQIDHWVFVAVETFMRAYEHK
jgi:TetR/AcrR family transcriptional regulator, mexJK operon transcriptional repressor